MDGISGSQRMSNRLFLVAAFAVIALTTSPAHAFWWRYGSIEEAMQACKRWRPQGTFEVWIQGNDIIGPSGWSEYSIARCRNEPETRQILGLSRQIEAGSRWPKGWKGVPAKARDLSVVKRFRY
ncbi:MAG TPA: hypothetical protein DEB70_00015 [Planctomycetaceae bacterium]|nr:hypothetical protein [Planctomycetaceae bacterium]